MNSPKRYSALSLFSGAGGMDIGVQDAGFNILAQIEIDEHCCNTLRTARESEKRNTKIIEADIREVNPAKLCKDLPLEKGELDLLFGGPPCQSFSLAGKQLGLKDERGMLLFEVVRFSEELKPKVILVEQVKGLLSSKGSERRRGEIFEKFLIALENAGYSSKWRVVLAADYGVPQLRERLFVIATLGKNGFSFPERTYAPLEECNGLFSYKPHLGIGSAIEDLGIPSPKIRGTTFYDREDSHVDVTPARDRERIAQVPEESYLAAQTHLDKKLLRGLRAYTKIISTSRQFGLG